MSVADILLTFDEQEIGFTNSSGFLNYSCPDAGRYIINASKTGYRSASKVLIKVLIIQENSSESPVRSAVYEPSSDSGYEKVTRSGNQIPGFRGITVVLFLIFSFSGGIPCEGEFEKYSDYRPERICRSPL